MRAQTLQLQGSQKQSSTFPGLNWEGALAGAKILAMSSKKSPWAIHPVEFKKRGDDKIKQLKVSTQAMSQGYQGSQIQRST